MMKQFIYPPKASWPELVQRPTFDPGNLNAMMQELFANVRKSGDEAVRRYTAQFDKVELTDLQVSPKAISAASSGLSKALKLSIQQAKSNIFKFHASQKEAVKKIVTSPGITCWRESRPIGHIGIYVPGGTAPLFSTVLMLGIPARIAGCRQITLCTPPMPDGNIHPAILYAAKLAGITSVFSIGGAQAIAAMTFGTAAVPRADKIFGPGNQYVTAAKYYAQSFGAAIDLPAGPSEVLVIADRSCVPAFVAADLLAQAEHGADSQVILLTDDRLVAAQVARELAAQLKRIPKKGLAQQALAHSKSIVLKSLEECVEFSNLYAPEHLVLAVAKGNRLRPGICNAGSVFMGNYSCESVGDYCSGTNHTLPTNGFARSYSGVSLDSFVKKITFQAITKQGIRSIGPAVETMAEAEQLMAHKQSVSVRLNAIKNKR